MLNISKNICSYKQIPNEMLKTVLLNKRYLCIEKYEENKAI